jgi:TRAP-type mannitol/chloroaromatic compound transport system substrate-binding protein
LRDLRKLATDVLAAESVKSPMARKVYASFTKFQRQHAGWRRVSEAPYYEFLGE